MNNKGLVGWIMILLLAAAAGYVAYTGIPIKTTSNGTHSGYVTAIEDNGIFFKSTTVYFKTSVESTQEDAYCVYIENTDLRAKLQQAQTDVKQVTITFDDYLFKSYAKCNGEIALITGVN